MMGSVVVLCSSHLACWKVYGKKKSHVYFDCLVFVSLALTWVFWLRVKGTEFNSFSAQRILNCEV